MLLATNQQSSVAGQAASATQARKVAFSSSKQCVNYSLLKKKVGVSDGQAGDDGNVKTLTVSINAPQTIAAAISHTT